MAENTWYSDLIGGALDIFKAREQSKIDARLAQSREQAAQYENAWRLQQSQAQLDAIRSRALPGWMWPVMLVGGGIILYKVMR